MVMSEYGFQLVYIVLQLDLLWIIDWMSQDVCECLCQYGISLFQGYVCYVDMFVEVSCLCCGSVYILLISEFGFMVCKVFYCCDSCWEFFDYFKCI